MYSKITFEDFEEKYKPIINTLVEDASIYGYMFETFDEELEEVKKQKNGNIWTLLDDNNTIINGYHFYDRLGYLITEISWNDGEEIDVICYENNEEEEYE
jgi:hypothetical protein